MIEKASNRINTPDTYLESHHILPKSMYPEHKDADWNRVLLTAREHFLVHWLLTRMVDLPLDKRSMWYSFWAMTMNRGKRHRIPSRLWARLREQRGEMTAEQNRSRVWTEESKEKLRQFNKGKTQTAESNAKRSAKLKGRTLSEEHKDKLKVTKKPFTDEHKQKLSEAKLGKRRVPHSEETKERMRQTWAKKRGDSPARLSPR
jgi:hypothetical protein